MRGQTIIILPSIQSPGRKLAKEKICAYTKDLPERQSITRLLLLLWSSSKVSAFADFIVHIIETYVVLQICWWRYSCSCVWWLEARRIYVSSGNKTSLPSANRYSKVPLIYGTHTHNNGETEIVIRQDKHRGIWAGVLILIHFVCTLFNWCVAICM